MAGHASRKPEKVLSRLRAWGASIPPGSVIRHLGTLPAQRAAGQWSWQVHSPGGQLLGGSRWSFQQLMGFQQWEIISTERDGEDVFVVEPVGGWMTRTGRVLTEADIEALADEAERGYDIDHLSGKGGDDSEPQPG